MDFSQRVYKLCYHPVAVMIFVMYVNNSSIRHKCGELLQEFEKFDVMTMNPGADLDSLPILDNPDDFVVHAYDTFILELSYVATNNLPQLNSSRSYSDLTCKRGSVGLSKGLLIPRLSLRFRLKPENSNFHGFELRRPSIKGTKILLKVIKSIIIICSLIFKATPVHLSYAKFLAPLSTWYHRSQVFLVLRYRMLSSVRGNLRLLSVIFCLFQLGS